MPGSFLRNALWNVLGFSVSLASGILLSPYIIRQLGPDGYGTWALAFSLVDYLWLSDLGFRSAVLKYSAHYLALREVDKVNEVLNTALAWLIPMAAVLLLVITLGSSRIPEYFHPPAVYQEPFRVLLLAVGWSWAFGLVNNVFRAALEGFQQYGIIGRITILMTGFRAGAVFLLVANGYGLREMGFAVVAAQGLGYVLTFTSFRRAFPEFRVSWKLVKPSMLRQMTSYGVHTMVATVATQLQQQGAPVLIGGLLSTAAVGFYSLPVRLLNTMMDLVPQVGMVSGARSAELSARGDFTAVARLGAQTNRYCFLLFLPPLLMLGLYADPLFRLWINPEFATQSAPLVPLLVFSAGIAIAGQQNSSAILYGLGEHKRYSHVLLAEAILGLALMVWTVPVFGIFGVAAVGASLSIVFRGLFTPWLICRRLDISLAGYMTEIYGMPLLIAVPVAVLAWALGWAGLNGSGWSQLIVLGLVLSITYYGLAYAFALLPEHRQAITASTKARLARLWPH